MPGLQQGRPCPPPLAYAGRKGRCAGCKAVLQIPDPNQLPPSPPAPAADDEADPGADASGRTCPYCAEEIAPAAKKCKHCGEWLDKKLKRAKKRKRATRPKKSVPTVLVVYGVIIAGFSVMGAIGNLMQLATGAAPAVGGLLVNFLMIRLGIGLMNGEKAALYGITFFAALGLILSLALLAMEPAVGLVLLLIVGVIYGIPVACGFIYFDRLK